MHHFLIASCHKGDQQGRCYFGHDSILNLRLNINNVIYVLHVVTMPSIFLGYCALYFMIFLDHNANTLRYLNIKFSCSLFILYDFIAVMPILLDQLS